MLCEHVRSMLHVPIDGRFANRSYYHPITHLADVVLRFVLHFLRRFLRCAVFGSIDGTLFGSIDGGFPCCAVDGFLFTGLTTAPHAQKGISTGDLFSTRSTRRIYGQNEARPTPSPKGAQQTNPQETEYRLVPSGQTFSTEGRRQGGVKMCHTTPPEAGEVGVRACEKERRCFLAPTWKHGAQTP